MNNAFIEWCNNHKDHIFSNGRGSSIIFNFPREFLAEYVNSDSAATDDFLGTPTALLATADIPTSLGRPHAKLSAKERSEIRTALANGETRTSLALAYRVSPRTVSRIKNGK